VTAQPLQPLEIATRLGPLKLWRDASADRRQPLVLVVRGYAPPSTQYFDLPHALPEADFAVVDLPGNLETPTIRGASVERFAAMFDEALAVIGDGRPCVVLGSSTGGVAALAMRRPARLLLIDPPLSTGALWPLVEFVREPSLMAQPAYVDWVWRILGIGPDRHENRNYRPLLKACRIPGVVVVPGEPLGPPRVIRGIPGLMTAADRDLVAAHPCLRAVAVPGAGHNVAADMPDLIVSLLREQVAQVSPATSAA